MPGGQRQPQRGFVVTRQFDLFGGNQDGRDDSQGAGSRYLLSGKISLIQRQVVVELRKQPGQAHDFRELKVRIGQNRFHAASVVGQMRGAAASQRRMHQQDIGSFDQQ